MAELKVRTASLTIRTVDVSRRLLKQLPVKFDTSQLRHADKIYGWFYGKDVLGSEYSRDPHVLCVDIHGGLYLVRVSHFGMDYTNLVVAKLAIPQMIVL